MSEKEWKLMQLLWAHSPCTITQLVAQLGAGTGWSKHTIISMLYRLEEKGAVRHEEGQGSKGKVKWFYPCIDPEDTKRKETKNFLSRLYDGSLGLMLHTLVQEKELSKEEIDQLYAILKQAESESETGIEGENS